VSQVHAPGPLLASGRDADIFECGVGLVLRRSRGGRSLAREARTMDYARSRGYPVPAIDSLSDDGTELVMERVEGRPMIEVIARRPWLLARSAGQLGDLHDRLHTIEAPAWLSPAPGEAGDRLLHLDLHPLNVLVTPTGPVVIDWTNAARGDGLTDVALSWLLMGAGTIPGNRVVARMLEAGRASLVNRFLRRYDRAILLARVREIAEWKCADPNVDDDERDAIRRIAGLTA
jgi:aminoglycoside phosphotransferase (APT) family kinase protein